MSDALTELVGKAGLAVLRRRVAQYGLTLDDYLALLLAQEHRCTICDKKFGPNRPPCIDHDHDTGNVRGLLCSPCNQTIGFLHDNAEWLLRAHAHITAPIADRIFDTPKRHRDAPPLETP